MIGLKEFLHSGDIGVTSTGDELHIGVSLAEHVIEFTEIFDLGFTPTIGAAGFATVAGTSLAVIGPVLGMVGVFMALGSGYAEARDEIKNEATLSGFSQGFVAGLLSMSSKTVSYVFGKHGVDHENDFDPEADAIKTNAYNKALVAGYAMANTLSADERKSYIFEIREYTGPVSAGDWTDLDKRNYVIEYAAKLRLHFLETNQDD
jgi:hypothetical protein